MIFLFINIYFSIKNIDHNLLLALYIMKLQSILTTHFFIKNLKRQLFFEIVNDSQVLNHLNSRINTVDILYGCVLTYCVLYTLQDYHINTTKKSQYTFDWIFIILSIVFTKDVRNAI